MKEKNGGYFLLDARGLNVFDDSEPQIIPGIWKKAKNAIDSGKVVLLCNATVQDGVFASPTPISMSEYPSSPSKIINGIFSTIQLSFEISEGVESVSVTNYLG